MVLLKRCWTKDPAEASSRSLVLSSETLSLWTDRRARVLFVNKALETAHTTASCSSLLMWFHVTSVIASGGPALPCLEKNVLGGRLQSTLWALGWKKSKDCLVPVGPLHILKRRAVKALCPLPPLPFSVFLPLCLPSSYNDCLMNTGSFFLLIQKQTDSDVAINPSFLRVPSIESQLSVIVTCEPWAVICLGRLIKSLGLALAKSLWPWYTIITFRFA